MTSLDKLEKIARDASHGIRRRDFLHAFAPEDVLKLLERIRKAEGAVMFPGNFVVELARKLGGYAESEFAEPFPLMESVIEQVEGLVYQKRRLEALVGLLAKRLAEGSQKTCPEGYERGERCKRESDCGKCWILSGQTDDTPPAVPF